MKDTLQHKLLIYYNQYKFHGSKYESHTSFDKHVIHFWVR